jgi:GNAT superfamily N-acetyltransferase
VDEVSGPVTVRVASTSDAEAIARLSEQLGYPTDDDMLKKRLSALLGSTLDSVYVAEADGTVVGWLHVFASVRLESVATAEIGGLIVDQAQRGKGVGERLVEEAEGWAQRLGLSRIRVRTRATRTEAHRFYAREGYRRTKLQHVLDKELD